MGNNMYWMHNVGVPPRTRIEIRQVPVGGRKTCFSLLWACCAAGLLEPGSWHTLASMSTEPAERRWGHNVRRFLDALATYEVARQKPKAPSCFLIGLGAKGITMEFGTDTGVCPDPLLTVHVLSRLAGPLYVPTRAPNLEWDTLFGDSFLVDDPSLCFPTRYQDPWNALIGGLP
jgi:hypothetical protein